MKKKIFIIILSPLIGFAMLFFIIKDVFLDTEMIENNNKYYIKGEIEDVYRYANTVYFIKAKIDSLQFTEWQNLYHIDMIVGLISPDSNYVYVRTQVTKYPRKKEIDLSKFPNVIVLNNNEEKTTLFYRDSILYEEMKLRENFNYSTDREFEKKIVENGYLDWMPF